MFREKNKRNHFTLLFGILVGLFMICLTGCTTTGTIYQFKDDNKIHVVTTIYPMQDFATQVAGDKAEIINLVPAGMEPHDFELSVAQMQLLEDADIFIYNGAGMEPFVEKTINSLSNKDLIVVEAAQSVSLLQANHSHEEEHEDKKDSDEKGYDPHTWLSIENSILEVKAIRDGLITFDENSKEEYEKNADVYIEKLEQLKQEFQTELKDVPNHKIVVAHEAFGYLCEEQGLEQEAIEGLMADSEPDASRMKEIVDYCKENNINVIFFEELVSPKVANTIANEVGARTDVLNPIEGRTVEQETQGLTYIDFMRENLSVLSNALK